jgi:hypothetical protein
MLHLTAELRGVVNPISGTAFANGHSHQASTDYLRVCDIGVQAGLAATLPLLGCRTEHTADESRERHRQRAPECDPHGPAPAARTARARGQRAQTGEAN